MSEADPFTRTRLGQLQEKIKLFANRSIINGDANEIRYLIIWTIYNGLLRIQSINHQD